MPSLISTTKAIALGRQSKSGSFLISMAAAHPCLQTSCLCRLRKTPFLWLPAKATVSLSRRERMLCLHGCSSRPATGCPILPNFKFHRTSQPKIATTFQVQGCQEHSSLGVPRTSLIFLRSQPEARKNRVK